MFGRGCKMNHRGMKFAGIYINLKVNGENLDIYTPAELTWACPHCHLIFLKSKEEIEKWQAQKHKPQDFMLMP